ncbi:helicase-related protein [Photobacterium jeanii]|uniref:helicase-related protein n=1 Tax=Photobacterium jeanii TaxID=858640 RepID=UPI0009FDEBDA|nr:helicase-related protein [Photobacterium jeanii]PST92259.1 ATP-dependent RNA helicase [Photobacterium jeanii]
MQLPIDVLKPQFLTALTRANLVVEAETGSGKSTRLPLWAAEQGRVLVIEPRRIACSSLAEFLATESGQPLAKQIGYAIRFENHCDDDTQIIFVTPGVALRWLSENQLSNFDTVIIDEFHERRWDTDLLLALLKTHNQHRIVLTSATIDSQRLTQYLGGEHLHAEGRNFPVEVEHYTDNSSDGSRQSPDIRNLERRVAKAVEANIDQQGDILVFLPGKKEIAQCQSQLKHCDAEVIPLHAAVSDHDRQRALSTSHNKRIILATNVAETSLTIPGVTFIIDAGLERRTHQRNGRTVLGLHAISQASAEQRKGRAGRIAAGKCIRLFGKAAPLELITPPELHREELIEPMLAAACCGHRLTDLPFIDALPEKSLHQAQQRLLQMNAINDDGKVTAHGKRLYPLPIDSLFAHLITAMPDKAATEAMADLSAALTISHRLWQVPKSEEKLAQIEQWEKHFCDATALIKLLREPTPEFITVDNELLKEARQLAEQIREALALPQLSVATSIKRDAWLNAVIKAAPELVYVRREKRRQALGNGFSEVSLGRDSRFTEQAEAAIVFDQFSMPGRGVKQTLNLATCMAPIRLSQLIDNDLGEVSLTDSQIVDGQCISTHQRQYAGRVIQEFELQDSQALTTEMVVDMIIKDQVMPGLAAERQQAISLWNLYLQLGKADPAICTRQAAVDFHSWLTEQIDALGIESLEDLALFENGDIPFDGIPEWELEDFTRQFPQRIYIADLHLTVEYAVAGKLATVVYESGKRKQDPQRWELPSWQGWRIKYRKASRVVDIR